MNPYIPILYISIINFLFQYKRNIPFMNILVLIILLLLCAFRGEYVGADTSTYLSIYDTELYLEDYKNEYVFYFIIKFLRELGFSSIICQVVMACITFIPLIFLFIKKSMMPSLSILLFLIAINGYYLETYNIVRQSAATVFLLWAYISALENNWKNVTAYFIIALGFHTSSLIYILFFIIALYCRFTYKVVIISILGSLFFAFILSNISFLTNIINSLQNIDILGFGNYSHFADYKLDMARNLNGLITLLLPHSFLCLYAYKKYKENILFRIYFCGCVFLNIVSIMPTSYRMAYGLTALELILFPMVFKDNMKFRYIAFILLGILTFLYISKIDNGYTTSIMPYNFI